MNAEGGQGSHDAERWRGSKRIVENAQTAEVHPDGHGFRTDEVGV